MVELSGQQKEALSAAERWHRDGSRQVFRLFGYAGTGKTTIAREFAQMVQGEVLFAAFTGKAALQLTRCSGVFAQTIHRLIYVPSCSDPNVLRDLEMQLEELKTQDGPDFMAVRDLEVQIEAERERLKTPRFSVNTESALNDAAMVVIDEVSMVGERMGRDLEYFGKPILVLGDTAQLSPVGGGGYFTQAQPDYLLTEIHRQAAGSPVLQLATKVRSGERLEVGDHGTSRVVPKGVLSIEEVCSHDQVIVGTNAARRSLNTAIRRHLGREGRLPVAGDRLVCLRNNYERGLLNGSQWDVREAHHLDTDRTILQISSDEGFTQELVAWNHYFEDREKDLAPWDVRSHEAFDFGYALTCHKAQGSQWDSVLVIDESAVFPREDRRRWLYTAITRAAKSVTIVRKSA